MSHPTFLPTPHARARTARLSGLTVLAGALLAACGSNDAGPTPNGLPAGFTNVGVNLYPATTAGTGSTAATQDLLTGGLGRTGLGLPAAPAYADPANPTPAELRRNALYSNYRGLVDPTVGGGYGSFYGPNVDVNGVAGNGEGLIPGREYVAVFDDASGTKQVTVIVQIPDSFSAASPCIVLGPSSGSRGVYGAIATAGEWGLKRGCAVALTDAGKGIGLYDPADDTVTRIDGTRATRAAAGALSTFAATISDTARAAFNAAFPNRLALKQVHSQRNAQKDWGTDTLASARYALWAINDRYGSADNPTPFNTGNTVVIGGSVSNGGAAVIRAAEADAEGLIDGVVAGEPVTEMPTRSGYGIQFAGSAVSDYGRQLADYTTFGNIFQPCAALAADAAMTELTVFNFQVVGNQVARATARCAALAARGLVSGSDTASRAADALAKLRAYGWTPLNDQMHNAHYGLGNGPILSAMYPIMYGRFALNESVCNTSFAAVDAAGAPVAIGANAKAQSFATANGTANGTPVSVVYDNAVGGPRLWSLAVSPTSGTADFGLDAALCQRALVTGVDETGAPLTATATASRPTAAQAAAVRAGIAEVVVTGNLRGKPTLIVAGRNDALIPVNHNARAYTAFNRVTEGAASRLAYIEVTNAQHFDAFNAFTGFDTRYVPLHVYFNRAMDAMWATLKNGAPLPASQVVRATPRGGAPGAAPAVSAANLPPVVATPAAGNAIGFSGNAVAIPN